MLHIDFRGPDFICLGVQKSGTTWLYKQFCKHPQFAMPTTKELRFFMPFDPPCSLEEYIRLFSQEGISGDMTPEYFIGKNNPQKIKSLFPRVKLFVILRNPTERAFSNYRMMRGYGVVKQNFIDVFRNNVREIALKGMYDIHLSNYLQHFRLNQNLLVMFYEDLVSDPVLFYSKLCRYLKAEVVVDQQIHEKLESRYKNDGLIMSDQDKMEVDNFYATSVTNLSKMLGRELNWNVH